MILCSLLNVSVAYLYAHPEVEVPYEKRDSIDRILEKRVCHEPLQYIQGFTEFYGYHIQVGKGCLIPRPETELLVEHALEEFEKGTFLDWGTGSGCISVAILKEKDFATGVCVECSAKAMYWAWKNLKANSLLSRTVLWHGCDLEDIPVKDQSLDLAVANPPYIPSDQIPDLMPEVRLFEPHLALDGGSDGLSLYYPFIHWIREKLKPGARILAEIGGAQQAEKLKACALEGLRCETIYEDFSNIPRVLCWRRV